MRQQLTGLRYFVNRRYVRAALTGLSIGVMALALGASALEITHDVPSRAIFRYFARTHYNGMNLGEAFANPQTTRNLEELFASQHTVSPGGFVYAQDGALIFYLHATQDALASIESQRAKEEIFPRLASAYHQRDFKTLAQELASLDAQQIMRDKGFGPESARKLKEKAHSAVEPNEQLQLLRNAAELMQVFVPYRKARYELSFQEKLRFYEQNKPEGEFVGLFEVVDLQIGGEINDPYAYEMARRSHFISIRRGLGRSIQLRDYHQGRVRLFTVNPVSHPSGVTLYKVFEEQPSGPRI